MNNDYLLQQIIQKLNDLDRRLSSLEGKGAPATSTFAATEPVKKEPIDAVVEPMTKTETTVRPARARFSEENIGKEWFNKIGAVSIIFGVVFFIGYTFQFLGPLGKILIGLGISIALLAVGLVITKKYKRYAEVVLALGWALLYFTAYASHYIEASRVVDSVGWNLVSLYLVAALLAVFSYFYNSERFSLFALALASISATITFSPLISLLAIVVISLYAVMIGILKKWGILMLLSVATSYVTYVLATPDTGIDFFWTGTWFLIIYFTIYLLASMAVTETAYPEKQYRPSFIVMNCVGFYLLLLMQLYRYFPEMDGYFTAALGVVLVIAAFMGRHLSKSRYLFWTYLWFGWGLLTLAVPMQLVGSWVTAVWLVEGAALLGAGLVLTRRFMLLSGAIALGLFLIKFLVFDLFRMDTVQIGAVMVPERVITMITSIVVFGVLYALWEARKTKLPEYIAQLTITPAVVATTFLMMLINLEVDRAVVGFALLGSGVVIYALGALTASSQLRTVGLLPIANYLVQFLIYDVGNGAMELLGVAHKTWSTIMGTVALLAMYTLSFWKPINLDKDEGPIRDSFPVVAALLLVVYSLNINPKVTTVFWGILGTLYLLGGFSLKLRVLRLTGMVVLILAILRLFVIDLSFLETVYRIVSFIVLGVILMGISFVYTKYKDVLLH